MTTLCQLADVKTFLGITDTNSDALLSGYIVPGVSAAILTWIGRDIFSQSYTEIFNGIGGVRYKTKQYPIATVSGVNLGLDTSSPLPIPARGTVGVQGYTFDDEFIYLSGYRFMPGWQNCQVVYTAGYAAVPADLEEAAIMCSAHQLKRAKQLHLDSENVGQQMTKFQAVDFPPEAKTILQNYRQVTA